MASTSGDNLCEFAGRVCYDSLYKKGARSTAAYHDNVKAQGHRSVYAHPTVTVRAACPDPFSCAHLLADLQCRPGLFVTRIESDLSALHVTLNLRAVMEWRTHGPARTGSGSRGAAFLYETYHQMRPFFPVSLSGLSYVGAPLGDLSVELVRPETPHERWCSLFIEGVSRDLLQELVRHHWQANPSVRSTRYVDEADCVFVCPPAAVEATLVPIMNARGASRRAYAEAVTAMTESGADIKTARGVARSCLLGATETKLVFSLSLFQARHLLELRQSASADAEIRRLADHMRTALSEVWTDL
jgi:thymidylate synthase ThyX